MPIASRKTAAAKTSKTSRATKTSKAAPRRASSAGADAIALLRADHKEVSALFEQYEKARAATRKKALVDQICGDLRVHAQIEEEIFYPAVKTALKDRELVPEALVEHASMKSLIEQIEGRAPEGEEFDAKVKVLSEYVKHHVKEEQNELFPKVRATRLDLEELGQRLAQRKAELKGEGDSSTSEVGRSQPVGVEA
jgi:hemerythrin-like domain-containing protein